MKSPMVEQGDYITKKEGYSELQVLRSPAGWYIGTMFKDPDNGFEEPGSRDSDYFATEEGAAGYLKLLEAGIDLPLREHP